VLADDDLLAAYRTHFGFVLDRLPTAPRMTSGAVA
jgi:hypothetical protein